MNKKTIISFLAFSCTIFFLTQACGDKKGVQQEPPPVDISELAKGEEEVHGAELKEEDIVLGGSLDKGMAEQGKGIYELKCQSCHKLTNEKLVGPGWKDVSIRRKPIWIMNMITNVEMMLEKDPEAQKLLELCMVRMPNQNLTKEDARHVLEFMRQNDGVK